MTTNTSTVLRLRLILCAIVLLGVIGLLPQRIAHAAGTFIPAPGRVDMVHDAVRDVLYISAGSAVLRYDIATAQFLPPFQVGGTLAGLDLSPDGATLVVADRQYSQTDVWVHVVDVASGASRKALFPRAFYEGGTFTVAFGNDGNVLITSTFQGSGWVPLRRYNPVTGTWTKVADVRHNTMLAGSADGSVIGFAESDISDGPVGRYRVSDGNLLRKSGYTDGTGWFNYEIGANKDGTQYAVPTHGGTFIFDASLTKIATIGEYAGPQPIGVVYHPLADIVYFAWSGSTEVRAYDSSTRKQVAAYNFEHTFMHPGNHAFTQGRLKMSRDGSLLFATVEGGIRYVQVAPRPVPVAFDQTIQTDEDVPGTVTLRAESGSGGSLTYSILTHPQRGMLSGVAPNLTYTPAANYAGPDSFTFKVTEGRADSNTATVTIDVRAVNDAPDAVNDTATTPKGTAVTIPVLVNDTDIENEPLTIKEVTQGAKGNVTIVDGTVKYTPQRNFSGTDTFTYTISDGSGGADTATVTVTVGRK